jgi:anti-anti-sigma factor
MSDISPALQVRRFGTTVTFRVIGRVTMEHSMPLRRLAEEALAKGATCLRVDLGNCRYMDSTFIGTLLVLQRAVKSTGTFALVTPSPECQRILERMALACLFPVVAAAKAETDFWEKADATSGDRECLKYHVCDAHEALVDVGGKTAEPFRAVAASLKRELEEERRQLTERR